ncbi:putative ribosomal RNA small subunit methyltransferase A [uncultured archaeon]|nr:putative ribosomal RNA small subunit methyltransferase A [uncultured archaeon]
MAPPNPRRKTRPLSARPHSSSASRPPSARGPVRPHPSAASRPSSVLPAPPSSLSSPHFELKKSRSQNFLTDARVLEGEAEALDVKGEAVLEIGAGDGRLSERILQRGPASLLLVEMDGRWAEYLRQKFRGEPRVQVVEADFLSLPDTLAPAGPSTPSSFSRIAGNIPYQITSPILLKLGRMKFAKAVLCVQKEVAERLAAPAGSSEYGRLSVYAQLRFEMQILEQVPRTSFTPPPKVDSAILCLTPKSGVEALPPHLDALTAALFSHRLQSAAGALVHARSHWGWSKAEARAQAQNLKIPARRVFQLAPDEFAELARALPAPKPPRKGR